MARFNRTRLIEQLREMTARAQQFNGFDSGNGTAQLRPGRAVDEATEALIRRAVNYGEWRAMQRFADDLEFGAAGTCCVTTKLKGREKTRENATTTPTPPFERQVGRLVPECCYTDLCVAHGDCANGCQLLAAETIESGTVVLRGTLMGASHIRWR